MLKYVVDNIKTNGWEITAKYVKHKNRSLFTELTSLYRCFLSNIVMLWWGPDVELSFITAVAIHSLSLDSSQQEKSVTK